MNEKSQKKSLEANEKARNDKRENEKFALDSEKFDLEKQKYELEVKKAALERDKFTASILTEEFRFRSLELIQLQNENNRWSAIYASALTVVIAWLLTNDKAKELHVFFNDNNGRNSGFILTLALINSVYVLSVAFKGYQVQQSGLFLYKELAPRISKITGQEFISFDVWRRRAFNKPGRIGKPDFVRSFYYPIISLTTFAVSATILILYFRYSWPNGNWKSPLNLYFYFAVLMTFLVVIVSILTGTSTNKMWVKLVRDGQNGDKK